MARGKKRGGRVARPKLDWVVNADTYGLSDSLIAVPNGITVARPLTFPKMLQAMPLWDGSNVGGSAYPTDGDRQFVKAVSGHLYWRPSSWVAGQNMTMFFRIVKKPMDFTTLDAIVDSLYSLTDADYANERFAWQLINDEAFNTGANFVGTVRVKATVNQWLEPDEALYLVCQMEGQGVSQVLVSPFLRTLMRVD